MSEIREHLIEEIREIVKSDMDGVSQGTVNRLQLTVLLDLATGFNGLQALVERVEANPSLVWLLRYRTRTALAAIILTYILLELCWHYAPQIIRLFVPISTIP